MSLQYGVASAIRYGRVDDETYVQFDDAELKRLIALTRIEVVPEYQTSLAKLMQPALVEVRMAGGRVEAVAVEDVPWLSSEAIEARYRQEADRLLPPAQAGRLVDLVHALASLETCEPIFEILSSTT